MLDESTAELTNLLRLAHFGANGRARDLLLSPEMSRLCRGVFVFAVVALAAQCGGTREEPPNADAVGGAGSGATSGGGGVGDGPSGGGYSGDPCSAFAATGSWADHCAPISACVAPEIQLSDAGSTDAGAEASGDGDAGLDAVPDAHGDGDSGVTGSNVSDIVLCEPLEKRSINYTFQFDAYGSGHFSFGVFVGDQACSGPRTAHSYVQPLDAGAPMWTTWCFALYGQRIKKRMAVVAEQPSFILENLRFSSCKPTVEMSYDCY